MKSGDYILISDIFGIPGENLVRMFNFLGVSSMKTLAKLYRSEYFRFSYDIVYLHPEGLLGVGRLDDIPQLGNRITREELDKMLSLTNFSED